MKRLLLLGALSALALLVFASAAFAQTDRDCPGFPSQAAAIVIAIVKIIP